MKSFSPTLLVFSAEETAMVFAIMNRPEHEEADTGVSASSSNPSPGSAASDAKVAGHEPVRGTLNLCRQFRTRIKRR